MEILKTFDPDFSESNFKTYVDNIFAQLHIAIMLKKLEPIQHFVSEELYSKLVEKVETLKNAGQIQFYDELNIKQSFITDIEETENSVLIYVTAISRYMDYVMDKDGKIIKGHNKSRIEKDNFLVLEKSKNYRAQKSARKCPSCGANMDVNKNGKCNYCGTIYNLEEMDWILIKLETK